MTSKTQTNSKTENEKNGVQKEEENPATESGTEQENMQNGTVSISSFVIDTLERDPCIFLETI